MTDSTGQVIVGYEYDAFGGLRSSYGTLTNDFRFTGQQLDPETGLVYLRARYYDPSAGRFATRDPFGGYETVPASMHRYAYVQGNPVNLVDPTGLWTFGWCLSGALGVGAYGTVSGCFVVASNWDIGLTGSIGGGGTAGFISGLTTGPQFSSGNRLSDLNGPFVTGGASFRLLAGGGLEVFGGKNECEGNVWGFSPQFGLGVNETAVALGFPGVEVHGGATATGSIGINFLNDVLQPVSRVLSRWPQ